MPLDIIITLCTLKILQNEDRSFFNFFRLFGCRQSYIDLFINFIPNSAFQEKASFKILNHVMLFLCGWMDGLMEKRLHSNHNSKSRNVIFAWMVEWQNHSKHPSRFEN